MCLKFVFHHFGTDPIVKHLGYQSHAVVKQQINMCSLRWLSIKFVWTIILLFWSCGLCNSLFWNLWSLDQNCYRHLQSKQQDWTKGAPEEAKLGPTGTLQRFQITGREQQRAGIFTSRANGSKMDTNIWKCGFWFSMFFRVICLRVFNWIVRPS